MVVIDPQEKTKAKEGLEWVITYIGKHTKGTTPAHTGPALSDFLALGP